MPWLAYHNPEFDQKTGEVKITRCPDECEKQQNMKQIKPRMAETKGKGTKKERVQR